MKCFFCLLLILVSDLLPAAIICATFRMAEEIFVALLGPGRGAVGGLSTVGATLATLLCVLVPESCVVPVCRTISCASPPNRPAILNEIT